ncbi:hypothetical protein F511_21800 [Dorcoceras hygrometricum]|uniref:Uncharacterized protein n=1 Tax=Dorcoceras hygrometricum TaxID=472368 RepID=A0A2Z7BKP1_9LAMI|nr:hypothetical protein F511_21800 [Dorcoceras hygrometricum]
MRELRVTSCGFGKTVEEVERRRFVKLKRCVLEPAARGFYWTVKPALTNKEFSSWTFSKANPTADDLAKQFQQRRKFNSNEKFSSDAGFIFSTKNSDFSARSKILEQKTPPVEIRKDFSRVQGRIHAILSQSFVQATNQQVRDLGRIRAIELLPDFVQTAGFVLPDFTPYS